MRRSSKVPIRIGTPLVRTVKEPYYRLPEDGFVPGWDDNPGMMQHAKRISMTEQPTRPYGGTDSNHPPINDNHPAQLYGRKAKRII